MRRFFLALGLSVMLLGALTIYAAVSDGYPATPGALVLLGGAGLVKLSLIGGAR
jgi:hypothetical protein